MSKAKTAVKYRYRIMTILSSESEMVDLNSLESIANFPGSFVITILHVAKIRLSVSQQTRTKRLVPPTKQEQRIETDVP